jgi:hypothetical protein
MKRKLLFLLLTGLLFFCQCKKIEYKEYVCKVDLQTEMFPDSSFFSDIRCMQYSEGNIYTLDVGRRDIVTFSEDFTNMRIIGNPGSGPEELTAPGKFYVLHDTVYIMDFGYGSIKTYTDNKFLSTNKLSGVSDKRFFYAYDKFYIPFVTDSSIFEVVNKDILKNNMNQYGGKITEFADETFIHNERNLLYDNKDFFYAVSDNLIQIEKYDLKTLKFVSDFDLSTIPIIEKNLKYIASQPQKINSVYVPIVDSYLVNGALYLLCADLEPPVKSNQLIKITLYPQIEVSAIYTLPGRIYLSFCVSPDYIFAFDKSGGTIDRIKLSDYD